MIQIAFFALSSFDIAFCDILFPLSFQVCGDNPSLLFSKTVFIYIIQKYSLPPLDETLV